MTVSRLISWTKMPMLKAGPVTQWGYDSRVMQFFGPVGQGSIHDHAHELNNDLAQERVGQHQIFRPLIFFAHSLGGLVVKSVSTPAKEPSRIEVDMNKGSVQVVSRSRL